MWPETVGLESAPCCGGAPITKFAALSLTFALGLCSTTVVYSITRAPCFWRHCRVRMRSNWWSCRANAAGHADASRSGSSMTSAPRRLHQPSTGRSTTRWPRAARDGIAIRRLHYPAPGAFARRRRRDHRAGTEPAHATRDDRSGCAQRADQPDPGGRRPGIRDRCTPPRRWPAGGRPRGNRHPRVGLRLLRGRLPQVGVRSSRSLRGTVWIGR